MNSVKFLPSNLNLSFLDILGGSAYLKVGIIVFLLFLLVLSLAQLRRYFVNWSIKGGLIGIFLGFLLALILEGFLLISGKTALTELLGWKNPPKPISVALDKGRGRLVKVLGISDQIPESVAKENPTLNDAVSVFQNLNPVDSKALKSLICRP